MAKQFLATGFSPTQASLISILSLVPVFGFSGVAQANPAMCSDVGIGQDVYSYQDFQGSDSGSFNQLNNIRDRVSSSGYSSTSARNSGWGANASLGMMARIPLGVQAGGNRHTGSNSSFSRGSNSADFMDRSRTNSSYNSRYGGSDTFLAKTITGRNCDMQVWGSTMTQLNRQDNLTNRYAIDAQKSVQLMMIQENGRQFNQQVNLERASWMFGSPRF